jgi:hypothetical protein
MSGLETALNLSNLESSSQINVTQTEGLKPIEPFKPVDSSVDDKFLSDIDLLIARDENSAKGEGVFFKKSKILEGVDAFNYVSADMPADTVANKEIVKEITFNKELAKKNRPEVMSGLMAALRFLKPKTPNVAVTGLKKLHKNNTDAIKIVNIINQASLRVNWSEAHLEKMLSAKKLSDSPPEEVVKAAEEDAELAKAIKMSENARLDLYNKLSGPVNHALIKKLQADPYVGANAKAKLELSIDNAVKTIEQETGSKNLLEGISKQMAEVGDSIKLLAENLLSFFSPKMKM